MKRSKLVTRALMVALVSAGAIGGTAVVSNAVMAGWSGACIGDDWAQWDGNGNYFIVHGKCA